MNIPFDRHYINGKWEIPHSDQKLDVLNPSDKSIITQVSAGDAKDVDLAVMSARKAFQGEWSETSGKQRAQYLRLMSEKITENSDFLAKLEVQDNGKPLPEAQWDIEDAADCFAFYAQLAEELDENKLTNIDVGEPRFSSKVVKEAVGVVGAITPWNFPLLMAAWKIAPALAAGCTVVLKPSEVTPLTALALAQIAIDIGLPAGVLNIVTGLGNQAGQAISAHPEIDKIAFTGSVPTGSHIMQVAAQDIKNVSLELGGKSAMIVFEDSEVDKVVEWILFGVFWNQGQVCSATSRVLLHDKIYDKVLDRLVEQTQKITLGDGMQKGVLMGPLVNATQFDKVLSAIEKAKQQGARLLCGGESPSDLSAGYFVEPSIFVDIEEHHSIWKEEIFGPVLCIKRFSDEQEAIELANNSQFGLAGAVISNDMARCERVAQKLRAGIIWINCSQPTFVQSPWGGYKQSGIGRELGEWGLNNYLETKQITAYNSDEPWGWYIRS